MLAQRLRHIHERRRRIAADLDAFSRFETWEETCVPSYCHRNLAAAYMSWWRLFAAVDMARRHARWDAVLDFGASIGELRRLLPDQLGRYDFVERNQVAAGYLLDNLTDAHRETLDSAPAGTYSCVFALDALEHNADYSALLARLGEKLRPDGVLVLSGPTETWLYRLGRRIAGFDAHYHETNIYAIEAAARQSLEPVDARSLPPGLSLFRLSAWRSRA